MKKRGSIVIGLLLLLILGMLVSGLLEHMVLHNASDRAVRRHRQVIGELQSAGYRAMHETRAALLASQELPERAECGRRITLRRSYRTVDLADHGSWRQQRTYCLLDLGHSRYPYFVRGECSVDLYSGRIPLDRLDRVIGSEIASRTGEGYTGENAAAGGDLHFDGDGYLRRELRLEDGEDPWSGLRNDLGLPVDGTPLPPGIYSLVAGTEWLGVWVQGDLDSLRVSCYGPIQEVVLQQGSATLAIVYIPGQPGSDGEGKGLLFRELIAVNGDILDLQEGSSPSVQSGANLRLVCAGTVHIRSCIGQKPGPPGERQRVGLNLIVCGKSFFAAESRKASVVIDIPDFCTVAAKILVQGELVILDAGLTLLGGLTAEAVSNPDALVIRGVDSGLATGDFFWVSQERLASRFRVHYLAEVDDET